MSVRVMTAVWEIALPDSEKLVLLALADCANDEGHCWPSMATLAKKCSKGERTVQGCIKSLVANGHLTRNEVKGKGCSYLVHPRNDCTPAAAAPPQRLRDTPAAAADKPLKNHHTSEAKASSVKRAKPKFILPSHIPAEPWAAFVAMRKQIRKPMSEDAMHLAIIKLDKLAADGWPPGDVLNNSTLNSYQGLFPPKDAQNGFQRTPRPTGPDGRELGRTGAAMQSLIERYGGPEGGGLPGQIGSRIAQNDSREPPALPHPDRPFRHVAGR